jgi:hypothetical protein
VYVFLTIDKELVCYKNPNRAGHEDIPMVLVPYDLLQSPDYETYYNVCWYDAGTLFRCGHTYHRMPENARYCKRVSIENSLIGKVLEQR